MSLRMTFLAVAGFSALILGSAWFAQYVLDMAPCGLCMRQRIGHYFAIPLGLISAWALSMRSTGGKASVLVFAIAIVIAVGHSMYWAGFHIGVEQKWWEGLASCNSGAAMNATLEELLNTPFAACDVPTIIFKWFFGGLSMATVHLLTLLPLMALALFAAYQTIKGQNFLAR